MPKLVHFKDPAGVLGKDIYEFDDSITPTEMLMQLFPDGINADESAVLVNGTKCVIGEKVKSNQLFKKCYGNDIVCFINEPKLTGSALYWVYAAVAVAAVAYSLSIKVNVPGTSSVKESPNNTLQSQTNQTRSYQAYPDVHGQPKCYPDLGGEAVVEYIDNKKYISHLMCLGVGEYDVSPLKAGATLLSAFEGATQEVIPPITYSKTMTKMDAYIGGSEWFNIDVVTDDESLDGFGQSGQLIIENWVVRPLSGAGTLNLDGIYEIKRLNANSTHVQLVNPELINSNWTELANRGGYGEGLVIYPPQLSRTNKEAVISGQTYSFDVNEVDGQEIVANNQGDDGSEASATSLVAEIAYDTVGGDFTFSVLQDSEWDVIFAELDAATVDYYVTVNYQYTKVTPYATYYVSTEGNGKLASMTLVTDAGGDYYDVVISEFDGIISQDDPKTYNDDLTLTHRVGAALGPYYTSIECDELWLNITFLRGLKWTDSFEVTIMPVDSSGDDIIGQSEEVFNFDVTANTLNQQFVTKKYTHSYGRSYYRIEIRRTDDSPNDTSRPDLAQFESLAAIQYDVDKSFGNVTLISVTIPATINATSLRENNLNTLATRKTITYNTTTGEIDYTLTASRRFADALLHEYVEVFKRDPETLDLDGLYEIQERIDAVNPELGYFDYTFDDLDTGLGERMDVILNVARCFKFLDGNVYRFGRDEAQEFDSNVITQRDIAPSDKRNYSGQYTPSMPTDYDSIKLQYVDPDTNKNAYIYRSIKNGVIYETSGERPDTIELPGCRNLAQATDRAELEIRKRIYQRFAVTDTLLSHCALIDKGQTVRYAEQYNPNTSDGEILSVDGDIAYTSNGIDWSGVGQYYVEFKDELNNVYQAPVEYVSGNDKAFRFLDTGDIDKIYLPEADEQLGSVYLIGIDEELEMSRWVVTEKTAAQDGMVDLTMINYDDRIYEMDVV